MTSKRSSASVDDVLDSQQSAAAHGTRPVSYTSVTSQDVNSLFRRMVSLEIEIYGLDITWLINLASGQKGLFVSMVCTTWQLFVWLFSPLVKLLDVAAIFWNKCTAQSIWYGIIWLVHQHPDSTKLSVRSFTRLLFLGLGAARLVAGMY